MNTEPEALRSRNPGVEILPRGTGDALPDGPKGILKKRNKWFVAHPENTAIRSALPVFFYVLKNSLRQSLSALPAPSRREPWGGAALFLVQKGPLIEGGWHRAAMTGGVLCAGSHPLPVEHIVAGSGIAGQG